ncbi:MAG: hypothetical protein KKD48_03100 [Nanoarchaeota archaeon]|nr:hypothetical protein [Nanoarchaeota archaeon]
MSKLKDYARAVCLSIPITYFALTGCSNNNMNRGNLNKPYDEIKQSTFLTVENNLQQTQSDMDKYLLDQQLSGREAETLDKKVKSLNEYVEESDLLDKDKIVLEKEIADSKVGKFCDFYDSIWMLRSTTEDLLKKEYNKNIDYYGRIKIKDHMKENGLLYGSLLGFIVLSFYIGHLVYDPCKANKNDGC